MKFNEISQLLDKIATMPFSHVEIDDGDLKVVVDQGLAVEKNNLKTNGQDDAGQEFIVKSPLVGLIHFDENSEIGSQLAEKQVIAQIESMKLYNDIPSPVTGTILEQLVGDGDMVEFDQPLFKIKING